MGKDDAHKSRRHVAVSHVGHSCEHHIDALLVRPLWHKKVRWFSTMPSHKRFYKQFLVYTDAVTHKSFDTQPLFHRDLLVSAHRSRYAETPLHADPVAHRRFGSLCLATSRLHRWHLKIAILPFLRFNVHFVQKGCR